MTPKINEIKICQILKDSQGPKVDAGFWNCWKEADAVFIGSDSIDSYFDALSALWVLTDCWLMSDWLLEDLSQNDEDWLLYTFLALDRQTDGGALAFLELLSEPKNVLHRVTGDHLIIWFILFPAILAILSPVTSILWLSPWCNVMVEGVAAHHGCTSALCLWPLLISDWPVSHSVCFLLADNRMKRINSFNILLLVYLT